MKKNINNKINSQNNFVNPTITKGKKQGKAEVFYSLKDKSSMRILSQGLKAFNKEIDKIDEQGLEGDKDE